MPKNPSFSTVKLRTVVVTSVVRVGLTQDTALAAQVRRSTTLRFALLESGYDIVASLAADKVLPERIAQRSPT